MKYLCLIALFVFQAKIAHTQISPTDFKKITKLLGENFIELKPQKSYPYSSLNKNVKADTSLVVPGDTAGICFNNEFLLFRSVLHFKLGLEVKKMMSTNYVTVAEYQEFQNYVRDSIARTKLFVGLEDEEAFQYIHYNPEKIIYAHKKAHETSDKWELKNYFYLDWDQKFSYTGMKESPLLADMYLCQPERFYKKREFDERKLCYRYVENYERFLTMHIDSILKFFPSLEGIFRGKESETVYETKIGTISDPYLWARRSLDFQDDYSVLAQTYNLIQTNKPILGLVGTQAKAFCHWKQEQVQKELDKNKLNYRVWVTLPTFEDLQKQTAENQFIIPKKDYTAQWQITNEAYESFVAYVKDSFLRESLYHLLPDHELAKEYLNYKEIYFNEADLAWLRFDAKYRMENRYYFGLNFKSKINFSDAAIIDAMKVLSEEKKLNIPAFTYSYLDCISRSQHGTYELEKPNEGDYTLEWDLNSMDAREEPLGKDLNMSGYNRLWQNSGVRGHENLMRFIIPLEIPILPDSTSKETETIKKITYEQALAFYHWKYPIHKIKATDKWQDFVLPTKEQFEKIQRGEQIVIEEKNVEFPSPVFRYVVHIYPKQ